MLKDSLISADGAGSPTGEMVAKLSRIPDSYREFSIGPARAETEFGVSQELAEQLVTMGMPHRDIDGDPRFTAADLHYVSLRLGCATPYLEAMRWWTTSLIESAEHSRTEFTIRYMPRATPRTLVDILEPSGRRLRRYIDSNRTAGSCEISIAGRWPVLDSSLNDLLHEIASLDFYWMPERAEADVSMARHERIADCASASKLLVEECRALGVEARTAYGLLLAQPYSTTHNWAEIRADERWIAADPLLLALLTRFAGLDASDWPPTRSPGGILLRFAEHTTPIARADGHSLQTTFLTTIGKRRRSQSGMRRIFRGDHSDS